MLLYTDRRQRFSSLNPQGDAVMSSVAQNLKVLEDSQDWMKCLVSTKFRAGTLTGIYDIRDGCSEGRLWFTNNWFKLNNVHKAAVLLVVEEIKWSHSLFLLVLSAHFLSWVW